MKITHKTLTISGKYLELIDYHDQGVVYGEKRKCLPRKGIKKQKTIREDSLERTKRTLKRRIWSNESYLKTFITLTFAGDEMTALNMANKKFHNFIKRMEYRYKDFLYIGVPEYQQRGIVHYHLLTNVEELTNRELNDIWTHGLVDIRSIKKIKNLAFYMTKYLTKNTTGQDKRFFNKKKIFCSNNIKLPQTLKTYKEIRSFMDFFGETAELICEKEIKMDWVGNASYKLYEMEVDYFGPPTPEEKYKHLFKSVLE